MSMRMAATAMVLFATLSACAPTEMPGIEQHPCVAFLGFEHLNETAEPATLTGGAEFPHVAYPRLCRESGTEGVVEVDFTVLADGTPADLDVIRGIDGGCDEAALQAVSTAEFQPALTAGGNAVDSRLRARFEFQLRCRALLE